MKSRTQPQVTVGPSVGPGVGTEGAVSRRAFIAVAATSVCAFGCSRREPAGPLPPVRLGAIDSFQLGITPFDLYRVRLYCRSVREGNVERRLFSAVSMVCTHQVCILQQESDRSFTCPCHGSRFDPAGVVLHGPAVKPLPWYELTVDSDRFLQLHFDHVVTSDWSLRV